MKVYALKKNFQAQDSDGWYHWVDSVIIKHYLTRVLACNALDALLANTPLKTSKVWDGKLGDMRNVIQLTEGAGSEKSAEKYNLYFIEEIDIIDRE